MKAELLLFSNFTSGGHLFQNFGFERHHDFEKNSKFSKFQIKIDCSVSALVSARCQIWKEQHLSFHWKKINIIKLFLIILSLKTWTLCKSSIFKRFMCQHDWVTFMAPENFFKGTNQICTERTIILHVSIFEKWILENVFVDYFLQNSSINPQVFA